MANLFKDLTYETVNGKIILSNKVKVFPTANRGQIEGLNSTKPINLESRLQTEHNLTNTNSGFRSYIKSWDIDSETKVLEVYINGYYFEISDFDITSISDSVPTYLYIKLATTAINIDENTSILSSFRLQSIEDDTSNVLDPSYDQILDYKDGDNYYFTGLFFTTTRIAGLPGIQITSLNNNTLVKNYNVFLPYISNGLGTNSVIIGNDSQPTNVIGNYTIVEGHNVIAAGNYSHVEGYETESVSTANYSHAEGYKTKVYSNGSHAEGSLTEAGDPSSPNGSMWAHAEGQNTKAYGSNSHAEGQFTKATKQGAHAEGGADYVPTGTQKYTIAEGKYSHAEGETTTASGRAAHTEGSGTIASADYSHAEGYGTVANGEGSHAEGNHNIASGEYSHAEGTNTATSKYSHTEGSYTAASGDDDVEVAAVGAGVKHYARHAEGIYTKAQKAGSHAEGISTIANGQGAHAEGKETTAGGEAAHAEGLNTNAAKEGAHAEGYNTAASGYESHAEGYHTTASGDNAHSEGKDTTASGNQSHAEGYETNATNQAAHAEGRNTTASGIYSHAEGYQSQAIADGAHAEGDVCIASGIYSHAEGIYTKATGAAQHVFGRCNIEDTETPDATGYRKYIEIVGNGWEDSRSNARVLDFEGNEWLKGGLYTGDTADALGTSLQGTKLFVNGNSFLNGAAGMVGGYVDHPSWGGAHTFTIYPNSSGEASIRYARYGRSGSNNPGIQTDSWIVGMNAGGSSNTFGFWVNGLSTTTNQKACITTGGQVQASSFYASSDKRLKENIVEFKPEKSILDLPLIKFDFIDGDKNQIGCLAQDLQEICPEIVSENDNGYLSINESKIVYLLIDEVKKLKAEVEELKKK